MDSGLNPSRPHTLNSVLPPDRIEQQIEKPIRILTEDELNAPIDPSGTDGHEPPIGIWSGFGVNIANYDLIAPIGRGGQGIVVRALQLSTGKAVAIKVLSGGRFASAHAASRFNREAEILASIEHPNIVAIIDRGMTNDGSAYFVMPLVRGVDLSTYLETVTDPLAIAGLFAKISEAVGVLHEQGICHRDLKPTNVLVDTRGEPRILDFGLAVDRTPADHTTVTRTGQILGSLAWASPEQARGETDRITPASDVYSLGIMLYVAAERRFPYKTEGPIHEAVQRITEVNPALRTDSALAPVINRCLRKDPLGRYPNASELAADLLRVSLGEQLVRQRPRRRWLKWLSGAVFLAGIASIVSWKNHGFAGPTTQPVDRPSIIELPARDNAAGMRMLKIPAGMYFMGSAAWEPGHRPNEELHRVEMASFWVSAKLVTEADYARVTGRPVPTGVDPNLPVTNVSWTDALAFCFKLGQTDHRTYQLPSEEQWEYACRASSDSKEFALKKLDLVAWFKSNSGGTLHAAGLRSPNRWGLYDVEGDVWQWCQNKFDSPESPLDSRAIRGGSFRSSELDCRCALRRNAQLNSRSDDIGFRVVSD